VCAAAASKPVVDSPGTQASKRRRGEKAVVVLPSTDSDAESSSEWEEERKGKSKSKGKRKRGSRAKPKSKPKPKAKKREEIDRFQVEGAGGHDGAGVFSVIVCFLDLCDYVSSARVRALFVFSVFSCVCATGVHAL
jgi:hypothetical protein